MKSLIKKLLPKSALGLYHKSLAIAANVCYGKPSEELVVIGVTGTNGKTSTTMLIARILEEAGFKVGFASTALFKIADQEWTNDKKMTMLGRFALQRMLSQMVKAGCQYAVVETSSEGIKQFRHLGIHYDACVFTNLTPEHIESHGGFENYKKAKLELFRHLEKLKHKNIKTLKHKNINLGQGNIPKVIVVNGDDGHGKDFLDFKVDGKIVYGIKNELGIDSGAQNVSATDVAFGQDGVSFKVDDTDFNLKLFGGFNVYNCLAAISVARSQGLGLDVCKPALENVPGIPGRMEAIDEGQDFRVIVDYAYEPAGLEQVYRTITDHGINGSGRIIHVLGSCGGGRDVSRRPVLGSMAAGKADMAIITNEDPYDDDPALIIDQVAQGAVSGGMVLGQNLLKILDRREAIAKAVGLAQPGDLVLITGKGSEPVMAVANGRKVTWDDRQVTREELRNMSSG